MPHGRSRWARWGLGPCLVTVCLMRWLTACSGLDSQPLPSPRPIDGTGDLLRALQAAGADPAPVEGQLHAELGGSGTVLRVGAAEIQVYEYASPEQRAALTGRLSRDGRLLDGQPLGWHLDPHLWATGLLLVAYPGTDGGLILLLNGLLGDPFTMAGVGTVEPYPPAVPAAMQALAEELARPPEAIRVVSYAPVDWPDACLGLPRQGEDCAQATTPGWKVVLRLNGTDYELRTDEIGTQVRRR